MKKIILNIGLLVIGALTITGCVKKANEWGVDPSHERLFKSLVFSQTTVRATDIEIAYTKTVSANKYIFEFSKDNLQFNEIVKRVEILADTLTPFANSTSPTKVVYRTLFDELDGNTTYSVRMKGVDTLSGVESSYSQFSFQTLAEQLFTDWDVFTDRIDIKWIPVDRVTHLSIYDAVTNVEVQKHVLTDLDKQNGTYELKDLSPGTSYKVVLYNETAERGVKYLKTSGLVGGVTIEVNPGDDIPALVSAAIAEGKPNVILLFKGGETYTITGGTLILPAGLANISFTGETSASGEKPVLLINSLRISDVIFGEVLMENLKITGSGGDFVDQNTAGFEMDGYTFRNCVISNYRAGLRLRNTMKIKNIIYEDCMISNLVGGYGLVNSGTATVTIDLISVKNSTLVNLTTQILDVRTRVKSIEVSNNTFYQQTAVLTQFFRFDSANLPLAVVASANIIAGSNSGTKINSLSGVTVNANNPMPAFLITAFAGGYRTSDMVINNTFLEFPGISVYVGSASDLFVDPANNDFHLKSTANFAGRGSAGDPRWF